MGLAEKRLVAAFEKDALPRWKERIAAVAGFPFEWQVDYDLLVKPDFLSAYPETLDYNFFLPLEQALQSVCADDLGRDSLRATIKRVKLTSDRPWSSMLARVEGDLLVLDCDPSYERSEAAIAEYTPRITKVLEDAL